MNLTTLSQNELTEVNGGVLVPVLAIAIAYGCWAASFCYELGRD